MYSLGISRKDLTKNMKKKPRVVYLTPQGTFQPSELSKVIMIIVIAAFLIWFIDDSIAE